MNNFQFVNPTKIIFGKGEIKRLPQEIPSQSKVLLIYGGGSVKKSGLLDTIKDILKEYKLGEFGGIEPNPTYETLIQAVELIRKEKYDFLLAIGGGSVIDGTKFIAAAVPFTQDDPWKLVADQLPIISALPFGTDLTLPATGSEMNSGAVITRSETKEKFAMGGPGLFPMFSILDPEVVKSIPQRQIANGLADSFTHVLEQYMTYSVDAKLQDRFAESILQTIIEVAPSILKDTTDYNAASNFMWGCTMALNGLIQQGVPSDWAIHAIGHELTALFGIDHARTLAIIIESHYTQNFEDKKGKLAQYAERVWNVNEGTLEEKAKVGIEKTIEFFHSLGIDTKLSDYVKEYKGTAEIISKRFEERGWKGIGEKEK